MNKKDMERAGEAFAYEWLLARVIAQTQAIDLSERAVAQAKAYFTSARLGPDVPDEDPDHFRVHARDAAVRVLGMAAAIRAAPSTT